MGSATHGLLHAIRMETVSLLAFTTLWTAIWVAPLPRLSRRAELAAGLIQFVAFGLRVFARFFVGVPHASRRTPMQTGPGIHPVE